MHYHEPVLLQEVLDGLNIRTGKIYVDCTVGGGGHSAGILERLDGSGKLIALDQDEAAIAYAQDRLKPGSVSQIIFRRANFSKITDVLQEENCLPIDGGVLADLGVSSHQLDTDERGFSFSKTAALDMRMDRTQSLTAVDIVNTYDERALAEIFFDYGEERFSRSIARTILQERQKQPILTTTELAALIAKAQRYPDKSGIHPATRVFQALRITVNNELGVLQTFLAQLPGLLSSGARIAVISFHSLEDRLVKRFFQQQSQNCICPPDFPVCRCSHKATLKILTRRPIIASKEEIRQNPRARSAKLRIAKKI